MQSRKYSLQSRVEEQVKLRAKLRQMRFLYKFSRSNMDMFIQTSNGSFDSLLISAQQINIRCRKHTSISLLLSSILEFEQLEPKGNILLGWQISSNLITFINMSQNKEAESPRIKKKCEVKKESRQINEQSKPEEFNSIENMLKGITLHQLIQEMIKDDTLENYLTKIINREKTQSGAEKSQGGAEKNQSSSEKENKIVANGWGNTNTVDKAENHGWGNDWQKKENTNDGRRENNYNRERNGNRYNQNFGQNQDNKGNDWKQGNNGGRQDYNQKGGHERRFSDQRNNERGDNSFNKFGRQDNQRSFSQNQGDDGKKQYERKDWNNGSNQQEGQFQKKREWTDRKPQNDQGSRNNFRRNDGNDRNENGQSEWKNQENQKSGTNQWGSNDESRQKGNEWGQNQTSNQWGTNNELSHIKPSSPVNPKINPLVQQWGI
ncbi:hypothetical protein pb186bvf_002016 [Paramecium bursaria]